MWRLTCPRAPEKPRLSLYPSPFTLYPSVQIPFRLHQLSVEQRRAGGAANCVVRERHVLELEHRAGANAPDDGGHAALRVEVELGLRPVLFLADDDGVRRRRRQASLLGQGAKFPPGLAQVFDRGFGLQRDGDGLHMPVLSQDPVAVRADREVAGADSAIGELAEQLLRLLLDFLFLPPNVRDDVAEDIDRGHARLSRA